VKRYRILDIDFDTRATILAHEIGETWEPNVKKFWQNNQTQILEGLLDEFGVIDGNRKIQNFKDLGAAPWSVIAFHNKFMRQLRYAFVSEAYYPALTAACALGVRTRVEL
jgi:hypothetical protein